MPEKKKFTADEIRQKISTAKDIKLEEMKVSEWDTTIWVCALTYKERSDAIESAKLPMGPDVDASMDQVNNFIMSVITTGVRDEGGNRVFTKNDIGMLMGKNSSVIERIATKVTELSGFGRALRESLRRRFPERP